MTEDKKRPVIGLLVTMTPIYRLIPSIKERMEKWISEIITRLEDFSGVVYSGISDSGEDCARALSVIESKGSDLILVFPVAYAPSMQVLSSLSRTSLPIVVLNTQMLNRWDSDASAECFSDNQAPTGVFDLTNVLVRRSIQFEIVSGQYEDPNLYREIEDWLRAAAALKKIRKMNIGLLGYPMKGAGDLTVDPVSLLCDFGANIVQIDLREYADLCENAPEDRIAEQISFDRETFQIDSSLTGEAHKEASRLEWGLRELVRKYELSGSTFHFNAMSLDRGFKTMPMLAVCKLLAEGIGFGGEGDVLSAAAGAAMAELAGGADFFETWGMDFEGGGILRNHMGEGNYSLARKDMPVRLVEAPFGISETVKYNVIPVFTSRPGDATLVSLVTGSSGGMKIITVEGSVPDFKPIKGINSPHAKFCPDAGLTRFLKEYAHSGGSHHATLVYGKRKDLITKLAGLMGLEYQSI